MTHSRNTSGGMSVEFDKALGTVTSADFDDLIDRIVRELDETRPDQCESTNVVPNSTQPGGEAKGRDQGMYRAGKLRKTPVKTRKDTAVGELIRQPHGGALRRGNPGNRGGGRPSHVAKEALHRDAEVMHERIVARLHDPSLRLTDLLDLYGLVITKLERYGL